MGRGEGGYDIVRLGGGRCQEDIKGFDFNLEMWRA